MLPIEPHVDTPDGLHRRAAMRAVLAALGLTLALYWIPGFGWLAWPLILLSTLLHELGHGLTALALGGELAALRLWPDGSGIAIYRGDFSALSRAMIASGGLLGPPAAALLLLVVGRRQRGAHIALGCLAAFFGLVILLWASSAFTVLYCLAVAGVLALFALRGAPAASHAMCVFLAVQMALASFSRSDYLFMANAHTGSGVMPSDVSVIADALLLPYWVWGALIAFASLVMLAIGVWVFVKSLR